MRLFDPGLDFYSEQFLPEKLAWEIGLAIIALAIVFIGLHILRRAFGRPSYQSEGRASTPPLHAIRLERYTLGARLYHWANFVVIALLLWSGAAFFFPGVMFPLFPYAGFSWLGLHVVLAWTFIALLIFHIAFSIFDTGLHNMWFWRGDGSDLAARLRFYLAGRHALPKYGKYNAFQKIYHAFLAIAALVMIATGISLFLSSWLLDNIGHDWLRWQRLLHDIFAFLFAAVIIAHIYLRIVRTRWPTFVAMISGRLSRRDFTREHDWRQWQPLVLSNPEARPASLSAAALAPQNEETRGTNV